MKQTFTLVASILGFLLIVTAFGAENHHNPFAPNAFQDIHVDKGAEHSVALQCNGTIRTWGKNNYGQLGISDKSSQATPVDPEIDNVTAVAAGARFTLVLKDDGSVWATGSNNKGQLGTGINHNSHTFQEVTLPNGPVVDDAIAIEAGRDFALMIREDGSVWAWGNNDQGQLGDGTTQNRSHPTSVSGLTADATDIAAGVEHALVLQENGEVMSTGSNQYGQLCHGHIGGHSDSYSHIASFDGLPNLNAIDLDGGARHTILVLENGNVQGCGNNDNQYYQLTDDLPHGNHGTPQAIPGGQNAKAVATGSFHTLLLKDQNTVKAWGRNDEGQCGAQFSSSISSPSSISGINGNVAAISAGAGKETHINTSAKGHHSGVLLKSGSLKSFGLNTEGQLGTDDMPNNDYNPSDVSNFYHGKLEADAGEDLFACSGDSLKIGNEDSPKDYNYHWEPSTGIDDPSSPAPKVTSTTETLNEKDYVLTKTYENTITLNECIEEDTTSITFTAKPEAEFEHNGPICEDQEVNFVNTGSSKDHLIYDWEFPEEASAQSSSEENPSGITFSSEGLKNVTLTVKDTICNTSQTHSEAVQVYEQPEASFASTEPGCEGEKIGFTNEGSSGSDWNYEWEFGSEAETKTSKKENPERIQFNDHGAKDVKFTVSSDHCIDKVSKEITINESPEIEINHPETVCQGKEVNFSNKGATGPKWDHHWSFGEDASPKESTVQKPEKVVFNKPGTHQITLATGDGRCQETATTTIEVKETPNASFTHNAPICENEEANFQFTGEASPNTSFLWDFDSRGNERTSEAQSPGGISYEQEGKKEVILRATDGSCTDTDTSSIKVREAPEVDFVTTSSACEGHDIEITNIGSIGSEWDHKWELGEEASPNRSSKQSLDQVEFNESGNQLVKLTTYNQHCSDSAMKSLDIRPQPEAGFTSDAPACAGEPVNFANEGYEGERAQFSWDFGSKASPQNSKAPNPTEINFDRGGTHAVTQTITKGECTNSITDSVEIYSLPEASAGKDREICANQEVQLGQEPQEGHSYSWFPPETLDDPSAAQPVANPRASETKYVLTVEDHNTGCQNQDTVTVTMLEPLEADAGNDRNLCHGDSTQIGHGLKEGQEYQWEPQEGLSDPEAPNPWASPDSTTIYTLTVTGSGCEPVTDQVKINVDHPPKTDVSDDVSISAHGETQLEVSGGLQYQWYPEEGLDKTSVADPIASPEETTTYTVETTGINGCTTTDSVQVEVLEPRFWTPNAFSPGGENPEFRVVAPNETFRDFELTIFSREGVRVFHSTEPTEGWNGRKDNSGPILPEGIYLYRLRGVMNNFEEVEETGEIRLVR